MALADEVEHHITAHGVTSFFVGHYGNFDNMAAAAVIEAKKRHPEVTLTLLLPYHPFDRPIPQPDGFDGTFYPPGMERVPKRFAIVRAIYVNGDGKTKEFCVHFACYSMKVFEQCVDFIADDSNSNRLASKGITLFAMRVDLAKEKIMEEYHPYRL